MNLDYNSDSHDIEIKSTGRGVPSSPMNDGFTDYIDFQIGNTPRYHCPYDHVDMTDEQSRDHTPKGLGGFSAKIQPFFSNSKKSMRSVNKNPVGLGLREFYPMTPQPEAASLRERGDSSSDHVQKFFTPEQLPRQVSQAPIRVGEQTYPGRSLASPVTRKLRRQDSDCILTEDSITFVRTEL